MPLKVKKILHIYINCIVYKHLRKMNLNLDATFHLSGSIGQTLSGSNLVKKKKLFYDRQMYAFFLSQGCSYMLSHLVIISTSFRLV